MIMAVGQYYPSIEEAINESGFADDANQGNVFIMERKVKSPTEADGIRVLYVGVGGSDPDGSDLTKWTYSLESGWSSEALLADVTRAAVIAEVETIGGSQVSAVISDADRTALLAVLTA